MRETTTKPVKLEVDGITVYGDTVRGAQRALKAEKARRQAAFNGSLSAAFEMLGRICAAAGEPGSRGGGEKLTDEQLARIVKRDPESSFYQRWTVEVWQSGGKATRDFLGYRPVAVYERANGETTMIEVDDVTDGRGIIVYAVGVSDGETALVQVPQYIIDQMRTRDLALVS